MSMWIISRGVVLLILLMEYKVLRDFLLHRSSINNSARLSNKFRDFTSVSSLIYRVYFLTCDHDNSLQNMRLTKILHSLSNNLHILSMTFIPRPGLYQVFLILLLTPLVHALLQWFPVQVRTRRSKWVQVSDKENSKGTSSVLGMALEDFIFVVFVHDRNIVSEGSRTSWRDIGYEKRIWQSLHKYFKKLYKPTNNNLRTSSNSRNKTEDTTPRKPKRVKDYAYHKEKMMMCKQAEQGVPLQAEQADWLEDTDEEIDEQELEAHYSYMAKIQEVSPAESSLLITPLETGKTKKVFKAIKESEASLTQELKECKTNLDESSRLGGATSSRDSSLIALQTKQTGCLRSTRPLMNTNE
ncbi:hypothetical protein Tco_0231420 [Tanacetum coccineum]